MTTVDIVFAQFHIHDEKLLFKSSLANCNTFLYLCLCRRNLNYFSSAYTAAVSAVDPDAGNGELCIKVPSELWKQGDGETWIEIP